MEDTLLDEVDKLCGEYAKLVDKPISLHNTMNISIINALWSILTGEKLLLNDPKLLKIVFSFFEMIYHKNHKLLNYEQKDLPQKFAVLAAIHHSLLTI